jgi:CheY-like chemotaxis protein
MTDETVILIAEDDAGHYALIKKNLWRSCVYSDILHFKDGQEILDFLLMKNDSGPKRANNTSYVLLLDIRMPKVDGVGVLERIKQDQELRKMPVIMLTTTDDPNEVQRCYSLGANLYIVKPTDYNAFMDTVERLGHFLSIPSVKVPKIQIPPA